MKKIIILCTLLVTTILVCHAQRIKLTKLEKGSSATKQGIVYALPKTTVVVEVKVKRTETFLPKDPSLCNSNCESRIGLVKNSQNNTTFEIKKYSIASRPSVDEDQIYLVNPQSKWNKKKDVSFTLSGLGIIQGADIGVEDQTFNTISKGISTVIATASIFAAHAKSTKSMNPDDRDKLPERKLIKLIESRDRLFSSGTYGADLVTIQYQVGELNKLIAKEIATLVGITEVKTAALRFEIDLDSAELDSLRKGKKVLRCLLKYDAQKGLWISSRVINNNNHILYPEAFMIGKINGADVQLDGAKEGKAICAEISNQNSVMNRAVARLRSTGGEKGLAYRIPEHVLGEILDNDTPKLKSVLPIAQLGTVIHLPYKMDKANVAYYESMGSLRTVTVSSSGLNPENFGTAAGIVADAKDLFDGESTVEKLNKEVEELELRVRKKAAEDQLSGNN